MIVLQTIAVAFSMFSSLPMPQFSWNQENMRYAMLAFPFIGLVVGGGELLLLWGAHTLCAEGLLLWVLLFLLPLGVTGGIHADGFCDTCDALGSRQTVEKKLEILKDSHSGAFALIGFCCYALLTVAVWSCWVYDSRLLGCVLLIPVISRALSAMAVVRFPCAKESGLLHTFQDAAARKQTGVGLLFVLAIAYGICFGCSLAGGAVMLVLSLGCFGWYHRLSVRQFGGITGDLAGFFLCCCETLLTAGVVGCSMLGGNLV